MDLLKNLGMVLVFTLIIFVSLKIYDYMMTDGFYDAGSITGYTCPDGWEQNATDESNGTCTAPCFPPGNDSPQSFAYGPNSGGFPLNRRAGWDYCVDSGHSNRTGDFSVKSATVGGPPIVDTPAPAPASAPASASFPEFDNFKTYGVNDIVNAEGTLYIMTEGIGAAGYHPAGYPQHWAVYTPPAPGSAPAPPPAPMAPPMPAAMPEPAATFICPPGWSQAASDSMNGSCTAPCFPPGNDSPQSFEYGPNAGGYPLNQRSGSDYCTDSYNGNQSAAFSMKSATVGGPPIIAPIVAPKAAPVDAVTTSTYSGEPTTPVAAAVAEVPMTVSTPAPVAKSNMITPNAPRKPGVIMVKPAAPVVRTYKCPAGFKQVPIDDNSGTCTAPCVPGNGAPSKFSYGPKAGGYPISTRTGQSYCTASKFTKLSGEYSKKSPTVGGQPGLAKEGYEDLDSIDQVRSSCPSLSPRAAVAAAEVEASSTEQITKIKDIASRAAEVMADKMNRDTIPGLNITCPSGDKPKISYIRNSKFAKGPTDVNTLKGVRGCRNELSCSEPKQNQYIFNPLTEY